MRRFLSWLTFILLVVVILLAVARCSAAPRASTPGKTDRPVTYVRLFPDNLPADALARLTDNCGPLGMPQPLEPQPTVRHTPEDSAPIASRGTNLVCRDGYALLHSDTAKVPLWVCEHVKPTNLGGSVKRSDKFEPDPQLPTGKRAELVDYRGSGFDRGHMAPAGNQTTDATRKAETFYLSNMVPQDPQLNQKAWAKLEDLTRNWASASGGAWIITGPMYWDEAEENPATADGVVPHRTIGPNRVAVPSHTYKIVLLNGTSAGLWRVVAFVMPNEGDYPPPYDFTQYIRPVSSIEQRTGLNFFPGFSEAEREKYESRAGTMP